MNMAASGEEKIHKLSERKSQTNLIPRGIRSIRKGPGASGQRT